MTDYKQNAYDDDDMRQVLAKWRKLEKQKLSVLATARGEASGFAGKQKDLIKEAADDLGIPRAVLRPLIRKLKKAEEIKAIDDGVDEEYREVYADASGQFQFWPEDEEEAKPKKPKKAKAGDKDWPDDAAAAAKKQSDAEQVEGDALTKNAGKGADAGAFMDAR